MALIFSVLLFQIQIANCLTYSFYEGEELQEYELANNELLLFTKESDSGVELDWVIQTHFFQAVVLNKEGGSAIIQLNEEDSALELNAILLKGDKRYAGAELAPILYLADSPKNETTRRIVTRDILVRSVDIEEAENIVEGTGAIFISATLVPDLFCVLYSSTFEALRAAVQLSENGFEIAPVLARRMQKRFPL